MEVQEDYNNKLRNRAHNLLGILRKISNGKNVHNVNNKIHVLKAYISMRRLSASSQKRLETALVSTRKYIQKEVNIIITKR